MATFSRKTVAGYFIKLLFFTVLVTGLAQTYYLFDSQRGIPSKIASLFSGMEIKDGVLYPNRSTPYFPPSYQLQPIWEQLLGTAQILGGNTDSMLVIDTSEHGNYPQKALYVMKKKELVLMVNDSPFLSKPYEELLHNTGSYKFTPDEIRMTLYKNISGIFISCLTLSFVENIFALIFSIFFLGTAAFIFRVESNTKFFFYLRAACFAVTPIAVGTIIIGLSGVRLYWTWHILIFISTIVMFRAIIASTKPKDITDEKL